MKSNASLLYNVFLVVGDFMALVLAFIVAFILRVTFGITFGSTTIEHPVHAITYLGIFLLLLPFWLLIFALFGLYQEQIYEKRFSEAGRLFFASFAGLLFVLSYAYTVNDTIFPAKLVPIYGFILAFIFLLLFRNTARIIKATLYKYDFGVTNLLLVGDTKMTYLLLDELKDWRRSGYRIIGIVGEKGQERIKNLRMFANFEEAIHTLGVNQIHSIVQTELYPSTIKNNDILTFAQENHIAFRFVPGNTELFVGKIKVELFRSSLPVVAVHQTALIGWGRVVKRLFDLLIGGTLLIVASPFMLLIAIAEIFTGGDVFFRQTRLTRFNYEFKVFKFRTFKKAYNGLSPEEGFRKMGHPELIAEYREHGDQIPNDPRFSALGNFLRKTSLDELPQLINIVRGDISLVGPRPLIPEELTQYAKKHTILSVKSGLTGLAQVSGRRSISFDERRQLDMFYVQNWSFWLDIVILVKTVKVVFTGEGAK